ncbi:methyl-accepting chemotaxis protein [Lysinibacillus sphaericus]|uniref:methyl-accepting chemotaxis protein n=1 Tax=Lysinibacillus sphaericus TaxID=1421 RepID=UPI001E58AE63|nr:methyl-accepting chemotaxis protein [Lysinibacillus sphaericus]MCS1381888.1 methyl-accepting chemotaxis protein [Lysinibacillus sphaericus]UDK96191.1 methyl-accepting chemotaxis protein [Lysinibacillus sphaericus]
MKNLTMQMKMSLLIVTVILFVLIAVGIVNTSEMKTTIEAENKARLSQIYDLSVYNLDQALPGEWHLKNGELYKGDAKIAEETALIDKLGELSHAAITIFAQDTRVNTNIQVDGQRAIGTTADPKVTEAVLTQGSLYKGAADVVGKPYFTQYGPIQNANGETIGMIFAGVPSSEINAIEQKMLLKMGAVAIIAAIIAVIAGTLLVRNIVKPLKRLNRQLETISAGEGDLTQQLVVTTKDEIGDLATSFNAMLATLRKMMQQVDETANEVSASSAELSATAGSTTRTTEQLTANMQELASGASTQKQSANENAEAMQDIAGGIQLVTETNMEVSSQASEAFDTAKHGEKTAHAMQTQMHAMTEAVLQSVNSIVALDKHANTIGDIVEVIHAIADQTNLLALNASIEAARAGEHGKGFAVVAEEVRKLAEQSKTSAAQITETIHTMQQLAKEASDYMQQSEKEAASSVEIVRTTNSAFENITTKVAVVTHKIQEVSGIAEELYARIEQANASTQIMAEIAVDAREQSKVVTQIAETNLYSMEDINNAATTLTKNAETLQNLIHQFKY